MSTSLKTLSKPQRTLLEAVRDGHVKAVEEMFGGRRIRQDVDEYRTKTVNQKTWDALRDAGLVRYDPPRLRQRAVAELTDTGRQVLDGEVVNTTASLLFRFEIDGHVIERRVPVPDGWWGWEPASRAAQACAEQNAVLRDMVSMSWAESQLPADAVEVSR